MMPLLQNPIACGATLLLPVFSFWTINASASRSFSCTFRELDFCQRCLSFFDAHVWKPSEPTPAQAPPSPPPSPPILQAEREDVAPVTACGAVDPNSLPSEVWEMCLKGLDLASLVKLETAVAKTLPASLSSAFSDAWGVQEARIDPSVRAKGETARDRAIGSHPAYRRQLIRQFVEKLWMTGPAGGNETALDTRALVSGDYDAYVAFSRPTWGGRSRTFLAGDFVDHDDIDVHDDSGGLAAFFEFSSFDLTNWPSLRQFASSDGDAFIQRYNEERAVLEDDINEALGKTTMVTIAAIHRTTLTPSVIFTSDKEDAMDGFDTYAEGNNPLVLAYPRCRRCRHGLCRAGSMCMKHWDGRTEVRHMSFVVAGFGGESTTTLAMQLTVADEYDRCWRPWWLTYVLVFLMLCLICVYNVNFWLNHDLHATPVEFF